MHFTVATRADAEQLAAVMQPADVAELRRGGKEPLQSLLEGLEGSEMALSAWRGDELGCIFGVALEHDGTLLTRRSSAVIWSLTSPAFERYPVAFSKAARRVVRMLVRQFGDMVNLVDLSHTTAQRFLRFLGADVGTEPVRYGPLGQPFLPFRFRSHRA